MFLDYVLSLSNTFLYITLICQARVLVLVTDYNVQEIKDWVSILVDDLTELFEDQDDYYFQFDDKHPLNQGI